MLCIALDVTDIAMGVTDMTLGVTDIAMGVMDIAHAQNIYFLIKKKDQYNILFHHYDSQYKDAFLNL